MVSGRDMWICDSIAALTSSTGVAGLVVPLVPFVETAVQFVQNAKN